jgi:hypothetical protein
MESNQFNIIEPIPHDNSTLPNLNLQNAKVLELKSHFDVVRKLCYLPLTKSLVSVSEVIIFNHRIV